jgi:hypothetical protein
LKPHKIFLFGLSIVAIVFLISLVFPVDGWKILRQTFYFPDYRTWWHWEEEEKPDYKDIKGIITSVDTVDTNDNNDLLPDIPYLMDSVIVASDTLQNMPVDIDSVYTYTYPFEFPEGKDSLLYPFFRMMKTLHKRNKPIRILHYGDSQIESDRITSTIRNYMQKNFGGQGCGFIQIIPAADISRTFQQDISDKWLRVAMRDKQIDTLSRRCFGIAGSLVRYIAADTTDTITHIGLMPVHFGYRKARSFTHVRFFYGATAERLSVVVNQTDTQQLATRNLVSSAWWRFGKPQQSFHLLLRSKSFPDVYGIALDGAHGIAVDNIPLRGSNGLDFPLMNAAQMKQMYQMMDVKMLILQFGANVVTNISGNYAAYGQKLSRQLKMLKTLTPDLQIIVIGIGDMSQNTPKGYVTYPDVVKIRNAQRQAAFENDCVFWDLLETMGGENSMPDWVFAEPPLAQKDFIHFSQYGAKIIGELFCRAWAKEYRSFPHK